jgi:hypothetical protein
MKRACWRCRRCVSSTCELNASPIARRSLDPKFLIVPARLSHAQPAQQQLRRLPIKIANAIRSATYVLPRIVHRRKLLLAIFPGACRTRHAVKPRARATHMLYPPAHGGRRMQRQPPLVPARPVTLDMPAATAVTAENGVAVQIDDTHNSVSSCSNTLTNASPRTSCRSLCKKSARRQVFRVARWDTEVVDAAAGDPSSLGFMRILNSPSDPLGSANDFNGLR